MKLKLSLKKLLLAIACSSFALSSLAQWQWVDKDGRKVFSDRAPPADIAPANILKQPGARPAAAAPVGASAPASSATPAAALLPFAGKPGKDNQLETRKKQAEEEEAARKKSEEEVLATARAENCERAKKGLVTFQSGARIAVTNARGEREFMDDASRATETKRLHGIADSDCKK